jgi:hypothetical protein
MGIIVVLWTRLVTSSSRTNARSALFEVPSGGSTLKITSAAGSGVGLETGTGEGPLVVSTIDEQALLRKIKHNPSISVGRRILMRNDQPG